VVVLPADLTDEAKGLAGLRAKLTPSTALTTRLPPNPK
jgi:hypothetical protein